jgi:MoaA/NifB/PqqE/SkfB family radical SAM enzyme
LGSANPIGSRLVPAVCDVSVTNVCNAACDFCCFARDKGIVKDRRWLNREDMARALPILHRRGIRYMTFQGGEPLLHRAIVGLVADASAAGIKPSLITNGWFLPQKIESLAAAGLGTLLVSIDSHSMEAHEQNRGLRGLKERIEQGVAAARRHGITTIASLAVNRLIDYERLPEQLAALGFDGASFAYPQSKRLGSSSLVFSETSALVDFEDGELIRNLDTIRALKRRFPIFNANATIAEIQRHVRGEPELFPCVGGYRYFYLDWNLDIWRCEAWSEPLGSVFDLDRIPDCRDRCTACTINCYRNTSVLMHAGVAAGDALSAAAAGRPVEAARLFFNRSVWLSLRSTAEGAGPILRLARRRPGLPAPEHSGTGGSDRRDGEQDGLTGKSWLPELPMAPAGEENPQGGACHG